MFEKNLLKKNGLLVGQSFWLTDFEKFCAHMYPSKVATRSNASIGFKFRIRQKSVDLINWKAFGSEKAAPLITTGCKSM